MNMGVQLNSAILRKTPLGDVHVRHHFQPRNDGRLQQAQLRWHRDFVQDSIDPIANTQIVLQRLDVNIGGALDNRFTDDLVDEFDDRSFRIVRVEVGAGLQLLQWFESAISLENFIKRFRAHAVERFHNPQQLGPRHQHPLRLFLQKLRHELAAGGIEKIVGRENNRIVLFRDRQNVMLKNKSRRQNREGLAINGLGIERNDRDAEEISNGSEKSLL